MRDTKVQTLYEVLKKNLRPIIQPVELRGKQIFGGLLVVTPTDDICEKCKFSSEEMSVALAGLLSSEFVEKKKIGKRSVLVLGEWRIAAGVERYRETLIHISDRPLPHELQSEKNQLLLRYDARQIKLLNEVFEAFASTRKRSRTIAESVVVGVLTDWSKYPADIVMEGVRTFLEQRLHLDGYSEAYCTGIIRNVGDDTQRIPEEQRPKANVGLAMLAEQRKRSNQRRENNG